MFKDCLDFSVVGSFGIGGILGGKQVKQNSTVVIQVNQFQGWNNFGVVFLELYFWKIFTLKVVL